MYILLNFSSDTLFDEFYRLLTRMGPSAENIHIFSTHFYNKLVGPLIYPELAKRVKGTYDYPSVANWTKKCDIFTKDILMIPILYGKDHWVLYVIVNPGQVLSKVSDNEEMDTMVKPPFCVYMDSLSRRNTFHNHILYYLNEEAKKLGKFPLSEKKMPFDSETLPCFVPEGKYKHDLCYCLSFWC